jgi:hypothetical protein
MQQLFAKLGVDTTKLTHELRIFAAQLLYEMEVALEVSLQPVTVLPHWGWLSGDRVNASAQHVAALLQLTIQPSCLPGSPTA